jgi:hypothetical protein
VKVAKDELSHREDAFCTPHTKRILLSDLEVFELTDEEKFGLVICVTTGEPETMVA